MKNTVRAALVVASVLVAAGCGGGSGGSATKVSGGLGAVTSATSHAALVKAAKKEGSVSISTSFTEDSIPAVKAGFEKKYPFLKVTINEQTGDDDKRILLEMQAGQSDLDVLHLSAESYVDYLPYVEKVNLLKLTDSGALDIAKDMINPKQPGTMAAGSGIGAFSYNPKLMSDADAPKSYDDFLKPQFKNRKFLIDIEPANLASLGATWGEEKLLDYATKLKAQKPIWVRGDTNSLTLMAAGEYSLHAFSNYHSAFRVAQKSPDSIKVALLEPIPVRLTQIEAVRKGAKHPAAAALFMEYTAGPEVQKILDEDEPQQSSIYAPGSNLNELTSGKAVSVMDWDKFADQAKWEADIVKAWGFPSAEVKED